jgi:predicted DNA-binding transcriptional regulator AlpA
MSNTRNATDSERLALPAADVAKLLGISQRHLHNLNATGRLPRPIRLGRSTRWRVDELRDWLNAGCPARDKWELLRQEATP